MRSGCVRPIAGVPPTARGPPGGLVSSKCCNVARPKAKGGCKVLLLAKVQEEDTVTTTAIRGSKLVPGAARVAAVKAVAAGICPAVVHVEHARPPRLQCKAGPVEVGAAVARVAPSFAGVRVVPVRHRRVVVEVDGARHVRRVRVAGAAIAPIGLARENSAERRAVEGGG